NGLLFNRYFDPVRPSDPTISGGFKHVFAASSKGFPSHPADARNSTTAREKRLFAAQVPNTALRLVQRKAWRRLLQEVASRPLEFYRSGHWFLKTSFKGVMNRRPTNFQPHCGISTGT
ncbi:MAG: hypothetical protein AB1547_14510, partial [Thermodesulfobacteriota bacterium]